MILLMITTITIRTIKIMIVVVSQTKKKNVAQKRRVKLYQNKWTLTAVILFIGAAISGAVRKASSRASGATRSSFNAAAAFATTS